MMILHLNKYLGSRLAGLCNEVSNNEIQLYSRPYTLTHNQVHTKKVFVALQLVLIVHGNLVWKNIIRHSFLQSYSAI